MSLAGLAYGVAFLRGPCESPGERALGCVGVEGGDGGGLDKGDSMLSSSVSTAGAGVPARWAGAGALDEPGVLCLIFWEASMLACFLRLRLQGVSQSSVVSKRVQNGPDRLSLEDPHNRKLRAMDSARG